VRVIDIIKGEKLSLSFEVFPPKTSDNFESVLNVQRLLKITTNMSHMMSPGKSVTAIRGIKNE